MKSKNLTRNIVVALILGMIIGSIINNFFSSNEIVNIYLVDGLFRLLGSLFMNAIKMMMVPVVFFSLVMGTASIGDVNKLGRIGTKTLVFYLVTTAVAIMVALSVGYVLDPGVGVQLEMATQSEYVASEGVGFIDTLINIIPSNPIKSFVSGDMLQIIFFAMLLGVSITILDEKVKVAKDFFSQSNDIFLNMTMGIMSYAHYGVFGLMARVFATEGLAVILPLGKYFVGVLIALMIQYFVTYGVMIKIFAQLSPKQFFKNGFGVSAFAFSTSSSSATIPVTLETLDKNHGVDRSISAFTIPLGATINMDGTSIMQGVAVVLIAQLSGVTLTPGMLLTVVITATLASVGTAGVPGAGLIMLSMVLVQVGLDPAMIGLIVGIDRLLDMTRTAVNITGDQACTIIIAKSEGAFDEKIFYGENHKVG